MNEAQKDSIENRRAETVATKSPAGNTDADTQKPIEEKARKRSASDERFHPLVELTRARVRDFIREPEAVFWVFIFPVILACTLGIAFRNTAPEENRIAIEAEPSDSAAVELARTLSASPDIEATVLAGEQARQALRTGRVALVVHPSSNASQPVTSDGAAPPTPAFEYRFDPTRPESRMARIAVDDALQRALGRTDVASAREEAVTEPGARYIDWLIPGLVGLNLMGSGMWGLGFAVVYARTRKLLKRFAATPMRRTDYLLSFMLSRVVFLVAEVGAIILFARVAFSVAVHGSLVDLTVIALVGGLMFSGLGLLVASRPRTIEGVSGLMNLVMVPMWLVSGTFFSSSRFPDAVQPFIKALPLTAMNDSMRAVMSEGLPLASSWMELSIMLAWGLISFTLALKLFRWQ